MVMEAIVDAFERQARGDPRARRRASASGSARSARSSRTPTLPDAAEPRGRRVAELLASADREHGGFGGAPKFPPASALELLLARAATTDGRRGDARRDARRRHLRPARRRLRPLLGRRRLARPPLREDALRQRPARAAPTCTAAGARPRALPPRLRGDARLDAARDARPRGRLLLGPRRRLRGRGGTFYVWTRSEIRELLGRAADRRRRCCDRTTASAERGNFEGANILHLAARRRAPSRPPGSTRPARPLLRGARRSGSGRASTTSA